MPMERQPELQLKAQRRRLKNLASQRSGLLKHKLEKFEMVKIR
jgi:hypothetical protein